MAPHKNPLPLPKEITLLLDSLRGRIRRYVWAEGLAVLAFHLGVLFWISLAVDRFLEPPAVARVVTWVLAVSVMTADAWRVLLRYVFTPLGDRSMAIILERRFPQLNDTLLTVLESGEDADVLADSATADLDADFSEAALKREMMRKTLEELLAAIPTLRVSQVFRLAPLMQAGALAAVAAASVAVFFVNAPETAGTYVQRIFRFSDEMYPRHTILELEGFKDGKIRIARGSDLEIRLRAGYRKSIYDAPDAAPRELRTVTLYSRNEEGMKNRVAMVREGSSLVEAAEMTDFSHTYRSVLVPMTLDIYAGDAHLRDLKVEVVDSPVLGNMTLEIAYPAYMHLTPRTVPISGVMSVPVGADVTIHAAANKPLEAVEVVRTVDGEKSEPQTLAMSPADATRLAWNIGRFTQDTVFHFTLKDQDGLTSRSATRVALTREDDQLPHVAVQPYGIGTAITVNAKIPVKGKITDDHGVVSVAFDFRVERIPDGPEAEVAAEEPEGMVLDYTGATPAYQTIHDYATSPTEITLDGTPPAVLEVEPFKLKLKDRFQISVVAEDRYDLDADFAPAPRAADAGRNPARLGRSQPVILDVVTPERLRLLLEAREITLRQLYEAVYQEVLDSRDSLQRIVIADWKNQAETEEVKTESPEHQQALMSYRVERVVQNDRKNLHEILGVAEGVENICQQMVNNRIDTPTWLERLRDGVMSPLRKIANEDFQKLEVTLVKLRRAIDANQVPEAKSLHTQALREMDATILAMEAVLAKMAEMQDFSEMIEILRDVIRGQEEVNEDTKKYHREGLKDLEL